MSCVCSSDAAHLVRRSVQERCSMQRLEGRVSLVLGSVERIFDYQLACFFQDSRGGVAANFQLIASKFSLYLPPATPSTGTAAATSSTSLRSSFTSTEPMFSSRLGILVVPAVQCRRGFKNELTHQLGSYEHPPPSSLYERL